MNDSIKFHMPKPSPKIERSQAVIDAQKKYYATHKRERNEYTKEYHKTWNTEVKICSCGLHIKNYSYVKHLKSKKHLKRIEELNKIE